MNLFVQQDLATIVPEIPFEQRIMGINENFKKKWKEKFPWIVLEDGLAQCKFCMVAKDKIKTCIKFLEEFHMDLRLDKAEHNLILYIC